MNYIFYLKNQGNRLVKRLFRTTPIRIEGVVRDKIQLRIGVS